MFYFFNGHICLKNIHHQFYKISEVSNYGIFTVLKKHLTHANSQLFTKKNYDIYLVKISRNTNRAAVFYLF